MRMYIPSPPSNRQLLPTSISRDCQVSIVMIPGLTIPRHLCISPYNPGLPQSAVPRRGRLQRDLPRWELPSWHTDVIGHQNSPNAITHSNGSRRTLCPADCRPGLYLRSPVQLPRVYRARALEVRRRGYGQRQQVENHQSTSRTTTYIYSFCRVPKSLSLKRYTPHYPPEPRSANHFR